ITEYGIADLRGRSDQDCTRAMLAITDAAHQPGLVQAAQAGKKLPRDFSLPSAWADNRRESLSRRLHALRRNGVLPDYPMGSDFTPVEERLAKALGWLKARSARPRDRIGLVVRALASRSTPDPEAMQRMGLASPSGLSAHVEARLLAYALTHADEA
ncbi:MAG TPA: acetyl-CoA hydrolase/transferase C-terminal domain-containing protein, partial [Arenimonas sp.]|nr:acetyl-CoA hydrolase/transferase C-terminal domain-containing protein [Arenimonas sp.]